jgi:ABC-2 type transport system permease protein
MTVDTRTLAAPRNAPAERRSPWRILRLEARMELLKTVRMPAYSIPALAFPALFYGLFGLTMDYGGQSQMVATYLLGSYATFGIVAAALFSFGVGVAVERGQGWMLLKRASPMPPGAYFAAKIFVAMVFAAVIVVLLGVMGVVWGGVSLTPGQWTAMAGILVAGALPFCALGLALGLLAGPNSAPMVVNLVYMPVAFASGLWIPIASLPAFFRTLAPWMPPYHLAQLVYGALGVQEDPNPGPFGALPGPWDHVVALAVFAALSLAVASFAYRRGDDRLYG